ncbi:hypothetical protein [Enterobacter phage 01_vB_Eclo_IJM]|nr:hypothetical protein [Enterobacter phage 01_vB_Eclo_IJM]
MKEIKFSYFVVPNPYGLKLQETLSLISWSPYSEGILEAGGSNLSADSVGISGVTQVARVTHSLNHVSLELKPSVSTFGAETAGLP